MTPNFNRYVNEIVNQTDASEEEKEDLREELLIHLELSYADQRKEGYSEKEAKQIVLENFGMSGQIGNEIQQAMFPYRKAMMLTLAMTSLLFSAAIYSSKLFVEGDAHIVWLVLSIVISSSLLIFTIQPFAFFNRKLWVNGVLLMHTFSYLYGMLLATSLETATSIAYTLVSWLIILLSIAMIYRTTIVDVKMRKSVKIVHALNMTSGIFMIAIVLFFIWAGLAFGMLAFDYVLLTTLAPLVIWLVAYIVAGQLIHRQKTAIAYSISAIPVVLCVYAYFVWFS